MQFQFETEVPYGSKVDAFQRNTQFLSFNDNLTLKVKVKVTNFQIHLRHLDAQ